MALLRERICKHPVLILAVLILIVTAFIFSNSLKNSEASHQDSDVILGWVQPLLEKLFGECAVDWSYWVRKTAHITEFCTLGILVFWLIAVLKRHLYGYGFFYVLAVAVLDEFIQSFTGRTSQILDVLIDFAGALLGFGIVLFVTKVKQKISSRSALRSVE